MTEEKTLPSPGSPEAQAMGCKCQPRDFEEAENPTHPNWITQGCPLHGLTIPPADSA